LRWQDGLTTVDLAVDEPLTPPAGAEIAFEGQIDTPGRALVLYDPERHVYWRRSVAADRVGVRLWVNDRREPDYVGVEVTKSGDIAER
jgi:hypothetical protein